MIEFKSTGAYTIIGRGVVFTVKPSEDIPFNEVFKKHINIDGHRYYCSAIERTTKWRLENAPLYANESIGLLTSLEHINESHEKGC